jgi:hypothetical protein
MPINQDLYKLVIPFPSRDQEVHGFESARAAQDFGCKYFAEKAWYIEIQAMAQCEARNPNGGGRCQRLTGNANHLCGFHSTWAPK